MIRLHLRHAESLDSFHQKFSAQLNDTHPAVAVAELMRLLVDEHRLAWARAWHITRNTFAYTNHTLLPEALETWPVDLFGRVLPRHLEIIYEINSRFLDEARARFPWDQGRIERLSLIDEQGMRSVRMAHLATVGSFAVNGVAVMHSALVKSTLLKDFYVMWPAKFHNVTNGVTPRRFVTISNPGLCRILTQVAGVGWQRELHRLAALERLIDDSAFLEQWRQVKLTAKQRLAKLIEQRCWVKVNPQ